MELERFKETLLEFLSDVTTISEKAKTTFMQDQGEVWKPGKGPTKAPKGYYVLSPFLLVKVETSSKLSDLPKPTRAEGSAEFEDDEPKEEIFTCLVKFKFYTKDNIYYISSTWKGYHAQYLGCICSCRISRPGEDWTRGHDLPDGYFCRETWEAIKNRIIKSEMKGISKYIANGRYENPQPDIETVD